MKHLLYCFLAVTILCTCKKEDDNAQQAGDCKWQRNSSGFKLLDVDYQEDTTACPLGKVAKFQNISGSKLRYFVCFKLEAGGWSTHQGELNYPDTVELKVCENTSIINYSAIVAEGNGSCQLPDCE